MKEPNEELDHALHVLYTAVVNYPCNDCDFWKVCYEKKDSDFCAIKDAFDIIHQEILRIKD